MQAANRFDGCSLQVKGGEDLRVDQRVEQLFEVMNAVMATSASCRRATLSNKTYKVGLRWRYETLRCEDYILEK